MSRVVISYVDLGVDYSGPGGFRSYELTARGENFEQLADDATIAVVDQDGGEIDCYGLGDASEDVRLAAERVIKRRLERELLKEAAV